MSTQVYLNDDVSSSDDPQSLREHPLVRDFASVDGELYELIKATNKTLLLFVNLAKEICTGGVEE
jgi:hypothetical protein